MKLLTILFVLIFGLLFSTAVFGQSNCTYTVTDSAQNQALTPTGGSLTYSISTQAGCQWTATSAAEWAKFRSTGGTGNGSITVDVSASDGARRSTFLTIAGQSIYVEQQGTPCTVSVEFSPSTVPASGGHVSFIYHKNDPRCATAVKIQSSNVVYHDVDGATFSPSFSSSSSPTYITIGYSTQVGGVYGETPLRYQLQQAPGCVYSVEVASADFSATGGTGTYRLVAPISTDLCQAPSYVTTARVTSNVSWIQFSGQTADATSGVIFSVQPNTSPAARTGTISYTVNDASQNGLAVVKTMTVTQAAATPPPCVYTFTPPSEPVPAAGGNVAYTLTSSNPSQCLTRQSQSDFNITGRNAEPNYGAARALELRFYVSRYEGEPVVMGGGEVRLFYVQQAARCTYTLNETEKTFSNTGGTGVFKFNISLPSGQCQPANDGRSDHLFPTSSANWITVNNQSGNATTGFSYSVASNPTTSSRVGTIGYYILEDSSSLVFKTLTITQSATSPCSYQLSNDSLNIIGAGGNGAVNLTTSSPCAWSAASNVDWIVLSRGLSGTSSGTTEFTVARNDGAARTGTITIGGQIFTVNQAAGKSRVRVKF